jgi:hypothetical protein
VTGEEKSGRVAVGMAHQGFDLQLTRYDERGWRATFHTTGMEHSPRARRDRVGAHAVARDAAGGCEAWKSRPILHITVLDYDILALHVAEFAQSLPKGLMPSGVIVDRTAVQHAYARNFHERLRLGGERRKIEAESENDREPDQPHAEVRRGGHTHEKGAGSKATHISGAARIVIIGRGGG